MKLYKIKRIKEINIIEITVSHLQYELSESGKKSNAHEFLTMDEHVNVLNNEPEYIIIRDESSEDRIFKRKITDIAYLCDSRITDKKSYLFSWG